jgi:hypothetical protein
MGAPGFGGRLTRKPSKDMLDAVERAAAFYQEFFDRAGIRTLPVIFAEGEKGGVRQALRFGAGENVDFFGFGEEPPDVLKPKEGEYVEQVPVEELLPMFLMVSGNGSEKARSQGREVDYTVPMPARSKKKKGSEQEEPGSDRTLRREASASAVAERWLSAQ